MIRMRNITSTMEFEREAQALQLLWTTGGLLSQDRVDILLRTMPERWTRQFRLSGGSHQSAENFVVKTMSIYDANDKRNRSNRYSSRSRPPIMRGGGRHGFGQGFSRDGSRDGNNNNNYNNRKPSYHRHLTNQYQQRRDVNYSNNYNHNNYGQYQRQQPNYQNSSYNNNYNNNRYQNFNRGPPGACHYGRDGGRNQGRGRGRRNWHQPRQAPPQLHFMQNDEVEQLYHIYVQQSTSLIKNIMMLVKHYLKSYTGNNM